MNISNVIEEIDNKLEKISKEHEKLCEEEERLTKEKCTLISKEVIDSKILTKTKWSIDNYSSYTDSSDDEVTLKAVSREELHDLQTRLNLWYHGDFDISENIRLIGDDGDFLIHANLLASGIEFIKSAGLEIDTTSADKEIRSLQKKADSMQEFINKIIPKK